MGRRQPSTQHRAITAIEDEKLFRPPVVQSPHHTPTQMFTRPSRTEAFTFNAEERQLVDGIDHPQAAVEFEAIDDAHRVTQPNVLGPQVAMPVDDVTRPHALSQ
jgi:hypothetical protein